MRLWLEGYVPPSNNVMLRSHWAKRIRLRKVLANQVLAAAAIEQSKEDTNWPPATSRKKLYITAYRKAYLDDDNFIGGLKCLIDCLKNRHLIRDDSPDWLDLMPPKQVVEKGRLGTEIVIEDVNEREAL